MIEAMLPGLRILSDIKIQIKIKEQKAVATLSGMSQLNRGFAP